MHRIIIDTDGGVDDALALLVALACQDARVEAITTVHGNIHWAGGLGGWTRERP
jgi:purine nucleosidase